ncbi:hypothetical protein ACERII_24425 [Evansella sp. AB-rgal1]|uniref:hypothetical protein n=1 Tax=Evansella sp. AB-rgal1 TaxID=3242696 RepID=UPI00359E466B
MLLERYRIGLEEISKGYSRMNGKVGVLGDYLRVISRLYSELGKAITNENEENIKSIQDEIDKHQQFLNKVLSETEKKLGEDLLLWYQELSNSESRTSNKIWNEIKTFVESQN